MVVGGTEYVPMAYYRMNTSKLSWRECFRLGGWLAPVLLASKLLGFNLADKEVCAADLSDLILLGPDHLETRCAEIPQCNDLRNQVAQAGGEFLFGYTLPPHPTKLFSLVYLLPDCLLELISTTAEKPHTIVVCLNPMPPANEKITSLFPLVKGMDADPLDDVAKLSSGKVKDLLALHRDRPSRAPLLPLPSNPVEVTNYIVARNQRAIERFVRRGLYSEVPPDDRHFEEG